MSLENILNPTVSTENIKYIRGNSICERMAAVFQKRRDEELDGAEFKKAVTQFCRDTFNINVAFQLDPRDNPSAVDNHHNAWVIPPDINRHSTMRYRGDMFLMYYKNKDLKKEMQGKEWIEASVNIETGRVSGWYSTIPVEMRITNGLFWGKNKDGSYLVTTMELAGIMLHEIGHLITMFAGMSRMHQRNYVLETHLRDFAHDTDPEQRVKIYNQLTAKKLLKEDFPEQTVRQLEHDKFVTLIITEAMKKGLEDDASFLANHTTCEVAADTFAVRAGADHHLITGLHKMLTNPEVRSGLWFQRIVSTVLSILTIFLTAFGINIFLAIFSAVVIIWLGATSTMEHPYDRMEDRYIRVRNEIIGRMKAGNLEKAELDEILKSLAAMDACIVDVKWSDHSQWVDILSWTGIYLLPWLNRGKNRKKHEQLLESLVNNELYVLSGKFKTKTQ